MQGMQRDTNLVNQRIAAILRPPHFPIRIQHAYCYVLLVKTFCCTRAGPLPAYER